MSDLVSETDIWSQHLGYELISQGTLPADLCAAWGTPGEIGHRYSLMAPASDTKVYIRLVETEARVGYWPPVTWGWNATEILVQDPDQLALYLEGTPIKRFGGPANLYPHPKAPRAIQTLSASGAMLYFTRILPGGSRYGLHGARVPIDRIFNVVLGGPSLDDLCDFYRNTLGLRVGAPMMFTMTLAAQACDAPPDTPFPICVASLKARSSILELDEYPENSKPRPRPEGCLPGGMSMVSFTTPDLDALPVATRSQPTSIAESPYNGRRTAVIEGPAGEWLELIESVD